MEEIRTIAGSDSEFGVEVHRPDGTGPYPVVVFFHHGPGLDDGSRDAMRMLAGAGYYVAAPDRHYRHGPWRVFDVAAIMAEGFESPAFQGFVDLVLSTTDDMVDADLVALLGHLAGDPATAPGAMGGIGYCIGARTVLMALARHPDVFGAGVALHPSFCVTDGPESPHRWVPGITGSLYVGIGENDEVAPPEGNEPLIGAVGALGRRGVVEIHPGAGHGFAVPGPSWHEAAAGQSYRAALGLFGALRS